MSVYRELLAKDSANPAARNALERLGEIGWSEAEVLERADQMLSQGRQREAAYLYERFLKAHPESERAREGLVHSRAKPLDEPLGATETKQENRAKGVATPARETAVPTPSAPLALARRESTGKVEPRGEAGTAMPSSSSADANPTASPRGLAPAVATTLPTHQDPSMATPVLVRRQANSAERKSATTFWLLGLAIAATAAMLAGAFTFQARRRRQCTVTGNLDLMPLPDVLQFLGLGGKVGILEVTSPSGTTRILLESGRIQQASRGSISGLEAVFQSLDWSTGAFRFVEQALPGKLNDRIDLPVQHALLQWAEREDTRRNPEAGRQESDLLAAFDDKALDRQLPF